MSTRSSKLGLLCLFFHLSSITNIYAQNDKAYLKDRGTGIAIGTYINRHEIIVYPYYEYYHDKNAEYKPSELGYYSDIDYRGLYKAHEGLLFLGYGVSNWLALEFETAIIKAIQHKSPMDSSHMPSQIEEQGLGDVEAQVRWRYNMESANKPEIFSFFEVVFPFQKNKKLIGTQDWELKLGTGLIKGFRWGTLTFRAALEYNMEEKKIDLGEYAIEYLKRVSPAFRFYIGIEGTQDEVELITDLQFHINHRMFFRFNNAFGITSKATDYAPEVGLVIYFNKQADNR
jgi:hypothetical protein